MKHPTSLQNYAVGNCNILKSTSNCCSCIFFIKLIHRDLVGMVTFGRYLRRRRRRKKNDVQIFWKPHVRIHSEIVLKILDN